MSLTRKSRGKAKNIFTRELFGYLQEVVTSRDIIWRSAVRESIAWPRDGLPTQAEHIALGCSPPLPVGGVSA